MPAIYISRLCGALDLLLNCGAAHLDEAGFITLVLRQTEATQGGMASISMYVELRCPKCASQSPRGSCAHCDSTGIVEELYSAWLAIPPGITDGHILTPTVGLAGMVQPVRFRVRIHAK